MVDPFFILTEGDSEHAKLEGEKLGKETEREEARFIMRSSNLSLSRSPNQAKRGNN